MIGDITTIAVKEWRELLLARGNFRGGWLGLLVMVAVFGVYMPFQFGPGWIQSPSSLVVWLWVPLFLVSSVVADSFAGERERRTLETLLASRLSDRAILFGKILAAVGYAWGLTIVILLLGVLTVNVAHGKGSFIFFPLPVFAGSLVLTLLAALLVSCVGVLVSLRAATVRQAAQTLSISIMLLLFVPTFGVQLAPDDFKRGLALAASGLDASGLVVAVAAVLMALDAALVALALARFQRAKLILD